MDILRYSFVLNIKKIFSYHTFDIEIDDFPFTSQLSELRCLTFPLTLHVPFPRYPFPCSVSVTLVCRDK